MKILVTGVTGFIGGRIANHLVEKGIVIGSGRSKIPKNNLNANVQYFQGSLNDPSICSQITEDIDIVIHCAGKAGAWGSYESFYEANVTATKNMLEASKENGVKKFINISSPSIYFNFQDQLSIQESFLPKKFSNHYAKTKYLAEKLVQSSHSSHFQTVSLRPRLVIGAGDNNVLPRLIRLKKEGKLKQIGDGKNTVTVTSIGNLLHAIDLCISAPASSMGTAYNIGNEQPENFWNFVNKTLSQFGLERVTSKTSYFPVFILAQINLLVAKIFSIKKEPALLPISIAVLAKTMTLDISHAKKQLGYNPPHSTQDALEEFADWWKKRGLYEIIQ